MRDRTNKKSNRFVGSALMYVRVSDVSSMLVSNLKSTKIFPRFHNEIWSMISFETWITEFAVLSSLLRKMVVTKDF